MSFRYFGCTLLLSMSSMTMADEIRILTWPDYLPDSVIETFTKRTHHKVKLHFFESDETKDLLINTSGGANYDIVVTSLFRLQNYTKQGWLNKITLQSVPNLKHLSNKWKKKYQESNQHCAPYLWGTLGILYRKDRVKFELNQWHDFFSPPASFNGNINLLNDSRDVIGMSLLSIGHDINSNNLKHINQAHKILTTQLSSVTQFSALQLNSNSQLIAGDVAMSMAYNGDALTLMALNKNLAYTIPSNGTGLWLDCMAIPAKSENKTLAYEFLNFIHEAEISAQISETLYYATPNKQAQSLISSSVRNNPIIYPRSELLERSDFHRPLTSSAQKAVQTIYSQLNFELKARQKTKH